MKIQDYVDDMNTEWRLQFKEPPRIANRSDALDLLDQLLDAEDVRGMDFALTALRDAVEREVI